ncbi:MAG: hypothetical protein MJ180_01510 [Candidatus Gastranaerophilales bacterium]|nr:hypothetical protein [Candidatus Gastranaerophilales bacterium]
MRTQAISMQISASQAYNTKKNSNTTDFRGCTCMVVPVGQQKEDSFIKWTTKNALTGAAFSLVWDLGTNVAAKCSKNIEKVPGKEIAKNVPKVAGIFLLVGGVFKLISNIIDK